MHKNLLLLLYFAMDITYRDDKLGAVVNQFHMKPPQTSFLFSINYNLPFKYIVTHTRLAV